LIDTRWLLFTAIALAAAVAWYASAARNAPDLPSGSSLPGFWLGIAAAAITVFELLLTIRKRLRGRARWLGPTGWWMRAHIWLGALCVPLVFLHSGFRFGGTFTTLVMMFLLAAVASGLVGLMLQHWLPRKLLEQVPGETIFAQIDHVMAAHAERAAHHLQVLCAPTRGDTNGVVVQALAEGNRAYRSATVDTPMLHAVAEAVPSTAETRLDTGAEPVRVFFDAEVRDYLLRGRAGGSLLTSPHRAGPLFAELRSRTPGEVHSLVDSLERLCHLRRQLDRQATLHRWLHGWLWIHLPLSWALLPLLLIHIITAVKYW